MSSNYNQRQHDNNNKLHKFLLATFVSEPKHLYPSITKILDSFVLEHDTFFVFSDILNEGKKIITYNVLFDKKNGVDISSVYNTIRMNRKKESNTLYTINGLNEIIKQELGFIDTKHVIKWEEYADRLIHFDEKGKGLIITPIVLISITEIWFFDKFKRIKLLNEKEENF